MKMSVNEIKEKKFSFLFEEDVQSQISFLAEAISKIDLDGKQDIQSLRFGFNIFFLKKITADEYKVLTTDYSKNPFLEMTEDLTVALWIQKEQLSISRKLNLEVNEVKFSDKIVIDEGILDGESYYLHRTGGVEKGDSGWYIGSLDGKSEKHYRSIFAFELLKKNPNLMQILFLPDDYMVIFEGNELQLIIDPENNEIFSSSKK